MEELYKRADRYSMLEDNIGAATQNAMVTNQQIEGNKPSGKKRSESKEDHSRNRKKSHDQSQKKRELLQFTPLNISYEKLLPIICDLPKFKCLHRSRRIPLKETNPCGAILIEIMGMRPVGAEA